jgi:hypothetical protein
MKTIEKIIKFYDSKIRMKLIWLSLAASLLLASWKGIDYRLIVVILSCTIYIILELVEDRLNGRYRRIQKEFTSSKEKS